jgi:hypothetical protein
MDDTAWQMVKIIRDSTDKQRMRDAAQTLIGILPTLGEESMDDVIWRMTKIIRDCSDQETRSIAQYVLVTFKNAKHL